MSTPFTDIYDLFLTQIYDYKINQLYTISITDFETYLQGFLVNAIPKFKNCTKDLTDIDLTSGTFAATLTLEEKTILSDLMIVQWMVKEIQDVSQFQLKLNDTDFKHYAESQNLKEKSEYMNRIREIVNQNMTNYGVSNIPWSDWAAGNYGI
jgi:hypothetical protein